MLCNVSLSLGSEPSRISLHLEYKRIAPFLLESNMMLLPGAQYQVYRLVTCGVINMAGPRHEAGAVLVCNGVKGIDSASDRGNIPALGADAIRAAWRVGVLRLECSGVPLAR